MRVHELSVSHFRGIGELTWRPGPGLTCLVGPGDSTKSTILDALSLLLAAGWNTQFSDADFTHGDTSQDLVISATLCDLSDELVHIDIFGTMLRGVDAAGEVHDDPLPGCDAAVTLELRVDASLEPVWTVVKDSSDEPRRLHGRAREQLTAVRLDDGVDRHLRWARGSALTRLTGPAPEVPLVLADSHRAARKAVFDNPDAQLRAAAAAARDSAQRNLGVSLGELRPGLDPALYSRLGSLNLHEGDLPVATYGLGTRRLMGLALQLAAGNHNTVLVVDEVENGLDPHRLRHFLRQLSAAASSGDQVLVVTHSPLVLEQLVASQLAVVRSNAQTTTVNAVPGQLGEHRVSFQSVVRAAPSALLARRIVVGEGATEVGFVEGVLIAYERATKRSAAAEGVSVANGADGKQAAERARLLASLGYEVAVVVDNDDRTADEAIDAAEATGVTIVRWAVGNCLEAQIFADVPATALSELLALAIRIRADDGDGDEALTAIRDAVSSRLPRNPDLPGSDPSGWTSDSLQLDEIRVALGQAAHGGKWFKRQSSGQLLGEWVGGLDIGPTELRDGLSGLIQFAVPPHTDGD